MNKTFKKIVIAGLACLAFCGTLTAAPARGNGDNAPQKTPAHQNAPGQNGGRHNPAPTRNCKPAHHRAPVAHCPPPPVHHEPPPPPPPRCDAPCEGAGWVALGAAIIGGIVGACL